MKIIIIFAIICFSLCKGPLNLEQRKDKPSCSSHEIYGENGFLDENYNTEVEENKKDYPFSYSDCIDYELTDGNDKFIEKCCYIRLQHQGTMHVGCIPLNQDQYSDIVETQRLIESGDKAFWGGKLKNVKVYAIECSASYLKLAFALLLGLLL